MFGNRRIPRIAYFISPHGYGHAARSCAVMEAVHAVHDAVEFEIFTQVPRWFFQDSLSGIWRYHPVLSDIGFSQKTPLEIDLQDTISRLDEFYPLDRALVDNLAEKVRRRGCVFTVCDIAPLGIAVARTAGIPSVLVENFTWDWLYEDYATDPGMVQHIRHLKALFNAADFHIQTEPVCRRDEHADLVTGPVSRKTRMAPAEVRERLGIPYSEKVVLITMGGIRSKFPFLEILRDQEMRFIIPGSARIPRKEANLILLPQRSEYFHPDFVAASDAVVGKIGYSTLAETYRAGIPFGYIMRKDFRESGTLVSFVKKHMMGLPVGEEEFRSGTWVTLLPRLLAMGGILPGQSDGSQSIAEFLSQKL